MQDFKRLVVWQRARKLALEIDECFAQMPPSSYGWLKNQILRCAGSIPANIAEGCGKSSSKELARFAEISMGSARELESYLIQSHDLRLISHSQFLRLDEGVDHVRRMLIALARSVRAGERKVTNAPAS
jgi:four helix bundle protein